MGDVVAALGGIGSALDILLSLRRSRACVCHRGNPLGSLGKVQQYDSAVFSAPELPHPPSASVIVQRKAERRRRTRGRQNGDLHMLTLSVGSSVPGRCLGVW
ncbi:hypothetical protein GJAV_G00183030 [Gymnothorax javanicus]|nr:hypothetical protein GJAV_G00183030 [Gymnothorax javanicus]